MAGIEFIERIVRFIAIVMFVILAWLCLGGENFFVRPIPISSFLIHLVMFFFFAVVSFVGWVDFAPRLAVIMVGLAVVLEVVQIVLAGRTFSTLDLAGNLIGVGIAWVFFKVLLNFKRTIRV